MLPSRMAKRSSFGGTIRKRLSDITNCQPQPHSPPALDQILSDNLPSSTKEYIDHLLKENAGLMKLIADKNKMIELNGVELQNLRITLQKTQLQNWTLAQSNSHMLAELNLGKQKLKALQHELSCKDALLKTKNLELERKNLEIEGQHKMNNQKNGSQDGYEADGNQSKTTRRRRPVRSQSIGPSTTVQQMLEKDTVENKRRCLRRQSARFRSQEREPAENFFEIEDLENSTALDGLVHEDGRKATIKKVWKDDDHYVISSQEPQRMSFGRPSRRAVEKVHSYKEVPLNIKLRRPA